MRLVELLEKKSIKKPQPKPQAVQQEIARPITSADLQALEAKLDPLYAKLGLDIEFTKHFLDRVNHERNVRQITVEELFKLFIEQLKVHGKKIAQAGPDFDALMNDISTAINVPITLRWNPRKQELEVVTKTVMRTPKFHSSDPKLVVGMTSKKQF